MQHVQMCEGGDLMEKTLTEAAELLQKISKAAAMRRDWETRLAGEPEHNSRMKTWAEICKGNPKRQERGANLGKASRSAHQDKNYPKRWLHQVK
jgi:urease accessory protein UreF